MFTNSIQKPSTTSLADINAKEAENTSINSKVSLSVILEPHFENLGRVFIELSSFDNNQKLEFKGSLELKIDSKASLINGPQGVLKARSVNINSGTFISEGLITTFEGPVQIVTVAEQMHKKGIIDSASEISLESKEGSLWLEQSRLITPTNKKIILSSDRAYGLLKNKPFSGIRDEHSMWQSGLVEVRTSDSPVHLYATQIKSGLMVVSGKDTKLHNVYISVRKEVLSCDVIIESKGHQNHSECKFYKIRELKFQSDKLRIQKMDGHAKTISLKAQEINDENSLFNGQEGVSHAARKIIYRNTQLESEKTVKIHSKELLARGLAIISEQFYEIHVKHKAIFFGGNLFARFKGLIVSKEEAIKFYDMILRGEQIDASAMQQILLNSSEAHIKVKLQFKADQISLNNVKAFSKGADLIFKAPQIEIDDSLLSANSIFQKGEKLSQARTSIRVRKNLARNVKRIEEKNGSTVAHFILEKSKETFRFNSTLLAQSKIHQTGDRMEMYNSYMGSSVMMWEIPNVSGSGNTIESAQWTVTAHNIYFPSNYLVSNVAKLSAEGIDLSLCQLIGHFTLTNGCEPLNLTAAHLIGSLVTDSEGEINASRMVANGSHVQLSGDDAIWAPLIKADTIQGIGLSALKDLFIQMAMLNSSESAVRANADGLFASRATVNSKEENVLRGRRALVIDCALIQTAAKAILEGDYIDGVYTVIRARALQVSKGAIQEEVSLFDNASGSIELYGGDSEIYTDMMITDSASSLSGTGALTLHSSQSHTQIGPVDFNGSFSVHSPSIRMQAPANVKTLGLYAEQGSITIAQPVQVSDGQFIASDTIVNVTSTRGENLSFASHEIDNKGAIQGNKISIHQQQYQHPGNVAASTQLALTSHDSLVVETPLSIEGALSFQSMTGRVGTDAPVSSGGDISFSGSVIDVKKPVNSGGRGIFNTTGTTHIDHTQVVLANGIESNSKTFFCDVSNIDILVQDAMGRSIIQTEQFILGSETPSRYSGSNSQNPYPHRPSNFRHTGNMTLIAKKALNDASNFLVKGKMELEGTDMNNRNRSHLYTWTEEVGSHRSRHLFHHKNTPEFAQRSRWITDGVANTQISEELELNLDGSLRNDGVFTARQVHGTVENLINGIFGNMGRSPINTPQIPFVAEPFTYRPGGEFKAHENLDLKVQQLTHNTGFASAGNHFTLSTRQLINEARLNTETEEVVRVRLFGRTSKQSIEVDHLNPGGKMEGKVVSINGDDLRNIGGALEGTDHLQITGKRYSNTARTVRSVVHLNSRKQSQFKTLNAFSVRTDFHGGQTNSGGTLKMDLEDELLNEASDITSWGDATIEAGNVAQRTLFSAHKVASSRGIKKGFENHEIVMREGHLRSMTGNLAVTARKTDIAIEGEVGSYQGDANLTAARNIQFEARTASVENRANRTTHTPTTLSIQTTKYNITRSSLPTFFAGRNGTLRAGAAIQGEGLREVIQENLTRIAQRITMNRHKVDHYEHRHGKKVGVSFFGSKAIETAYARKKFDGKVLESLLSEDPGLASVFGLARSRDGVDYVNNGISSGATLWNESAQFARAYNEGNLGPNMGQHFGLTDSNGTFNPSFTVRLGTFGQSTRWTETIPSTTYVGGNLVSNASEQSYVGSRGHVGNNATFNCDTITWQAACDIYERHGHDVGVSASFGPEGFVSVGANVATNKSSGVTYFNSTLDVGNHLQINARDSVTLIGAQVEGNTVNVATQRSIIQSLQDTHSEKETSGSFTTGGSFSFANKKANSKQVNEVTRIKARTSGRFEATEGMDLVGAAIQNIHVETPQLRKQDIHNEQKSSSFSMNVNARDIADATGNKTLSNSFGTSERDKVKIGGISQLGSFDYRKETQKGTTRATISGANGAQYGVNTDASNITEQGKKKKVHRGATFVIPNKSKMQSDLREIKKTMSPPPVPGKRPNQSARPPAAESIDLDLPTLSFPMQYTRDEIETFNDSTHVLDDSAQTHEERFGRQFEDYSDLNIKDGKTQDWYSTLRRMESHHYRDQMIGLEMYNNATSLISTGIVWLAGKACSINSTTEGWCEKALEKTGNLFRKTYIQLPDNFRSKVEHTLDERNRFIRNVGAYNERYYGIPSNKTFYYYENVNCFVLNTFFLQPAAKGIIHFGHASYKIAKKGTQDLFKEIKFNHFHPEDVITRSRSNGMLYQYQNFIRNDVSLLQYTPPKEFRYGLGYYLFTGTKNFLPNFIAGTLNDTRIKAGLNSLIRVNHSLKHHLKETALVDPLREHLLEHMSVEEEEHQH